MRKAKLFYALADSLVMGNSVIRHKQTEMKMSLDRQDLGAGDTLRYNVLTDVLDEKYERAIETIQEYRDTPSIYPSFKPRVDRLLAYSIDVIHAIQAKKSFSGLSHLTVAKQKEFVDKFKHHVIELKVILKKVEQVEAQVRLEDSRSTLIFVKVSWYSLLTVVVLSFVAFSSQQLVTNAFVVLEDSAVAISEMIW